MSTSAPAAPLDHTEHRPRLSRAGVIAVTLGLYAGGWGWLAVAAGLACLVRAWTVPGEGFRLLGPHFAWELRRPVPYRHLLRFLLALGLGVAVWGHLDTIAYTASMTPAEFRRSAWGQHLGTPERVAQYQLAELARLVATGPGVALLAVAGLVVPMGFASERANRRLDVLLATELTARELLASRALARMALVAEPLLLTLPFWLVLSLFHSVELGPAAWGVLPALATAFAVAMVGVAVSYRAKDPLGAVGLVCAALYVAIAATFLPLVPAWVVARGWELATGAPVPNEIAAPALPLIEFLGMPNPGVHLICFNWRVQHFGTPVPDALADAARHYCAGCVGLGLYAFVTACEHLRRYEWAAPAVAPKPPAKAKRSAPRWRRRNAVSNRKAARKRLEPRVPVFDRPLLWWAAHSLGRFPASPYNVGRFWRKLFAWALGVGLVAYGFDALLAWLDPPFVARQFRVEGMAVVGLREFVPAVAPMAFIPLALTALLLGAATLPRERASDTYETLILSAMSPRDILGQKLAGIGVSLAILCGPVAAVLAGLTLAGHLSWLTLAGWALALPRAVAFFALFGAACGARSKQVGRAVVVAVAALGLAAGLAAVAGDAAAFTAYRRPSMMWLERSTADARRAAVLALTPPGPLWQALRPSLPAPGTRLGRPPHDLTGPQALAAYTAGVLATWLACYGLWRVALYRLRRDLELVRGPEPSFQGVRP